jgi:molecular chaperone HtpG
MDDTTNAFHVDLRGVVDLLSRHLYSSPRVYLRELLQNALDAITARDQVEPGCPRTVHIVPADVSVDGKLHIHDSGIGLDEGGIHTVLATIGASTKRDELGFARQDFLGQFGIGLLSCFLVSDAIELVTRAVGSPTTLRWTGRASGTYTVVTSDDDLAEPGTEVILTPRADEELLRADTVRELATTFGAYLPIQISIAMPDGVSAVGGRAFSWDDPTLVGNPRREAAVEMARELLHVDPLDVIELSDHVTGVRGVAFVLPTSMTRRSHHRLYAKRMLVSEAVEGILPDWAFFVRAVIDGERLPLMASREALQDDEHVHEIQARLGTTIRRWLVRTAQSDPSRLLRFLQVHSLGAKALAADDDEMNEIVGGLIDWETTLGTMTLAEFAAISPVVTYTSSVEEFRQIAPLATAADMPVLNAGYAYDEAIVRRWIASHPPADCRLARPSEFAMTFEDIADDERDTFARLLDVVHHVLGRADVQPTVKAFEPATLHAVLLVDRAARLEEDRSALSESLQGVWARVLDATAIDVPPRQFVLNARHPTVRNAAMVEDDDLQQTVVEALYAQALLAGRHPIRSYESSLIARALPALIDRTIAEWRR